MIKDLIFEDDADFVETPSIERSAVRIGRTDGMEVTIDCDLTLYAIKGGTDEIFPECEFPEVKDALMQYHCLNIQRREFHYSDRRGDKEGYNEYASLRIPGDLVAA